MFCLGENNSEFFDKCTIPSFIDVRQDFPREDVTAEIPQLIAGGFKKEVVAGAIRRGMRIAVAVGSRGVAGIDIIVRETVRQIESLGAHPFIIPAMGTHGGCDPEKQKLILAGMGITEESMQVEVASSMDVVELGTTDDGLPVFFDRIAFEKSDGVVVVNRIKPHTDFRGETESGLQKMIAVGLGNAAGANQAHSFPLREFGKIIPAIAKVAISRGLIKLGIAVVEDAYKGVAHIEIVEPWNFYDREKELLVKAISLMGRLLVDKVDLLVVRELGKDVSGAGMDNNVINRYIDSYMVDETRNINRIAVLDLTVKTNGHAPGIGYADVVTRRIIEKMDYVSTYKNCIIGRAPMSCKIPITVDNDRLAIQCGLQLSDSVSNNEPRIVIIKNTSELQNITVSAGVLGEIKQYPNISTISGFYNLEFDINGNLCAPACRQTPG